MVLKKKCDNLLFSSLLNTIGVSGSESKIRNLIRKEISPYVDEVKIDKFGNLIARKKGPAPSVMLAAHMDEVGLMIKHIHKSGRIELAKIGGIETATLLGQIVQIDLGRGKSISGVISSEGLSIGASIEEVPEFYELFVDTGLSKKELNKIGVKEGVPITFSPNAICLGKNDIMVGKAVDDRTGCFILIELAKRLKKNKSEIFYVFTVQEEVGLYGARTSAYNVRPDWGVAVDVSDAEDYSDDPVVRLGGGPVLTLMDSDIISNKCINGWLEEIAKKKKIKLQKNVSESGTTDATDIALSRGGVPSTVLGVCVRNMHSAVGVVDMKDISQAVEVLYELLKNPPKKCIVE